MTQLPVCRAWSMDGPQHGGVLRSLQLQELFAAAGFELVPVPLYDRWRSASDVRGGLAAWMSLPFSMKCSRGGAVALWRGGALARSMAAWRKSGIVVLESTMTPHIIQAARRQGFRVLGFPHNIESLNDATNRRFHRWGGLRGAAIEAGMLARECERIWTVSSEDAWLLSQASDAVEWLPYVPPAIVRERAAAVRLMRVHSQKHHVLVLNSRQASADQAVLELLRHLEANAIATVVGGHGTEAYATWGDWKHVHIAGSLDSARLEQLLAGARAMVVWSLRGSGALTRIPEMSMAGVPVVCNLLAARSAWLWPGVHVVNGLSEIRTAIRAANELPPSTGTVPPQIERMIQGFLSHATAWSGH